MEFLKANWELAIMGIGAIFLLGAIFNVNFILDQQGARGFLAYLSPKAYRIMVGIIAVLFIAGGATAFLINRGIISL